MRRMIFGTFFVVLSLVFWGCGTVNNALVEKHKNVEYYRIFDIMPIPLKATSDYDDGDHLPERSDAGFFNTYLSGRLESSSTVFF